MAIRKGIAHQTVEKKKKNQGIGKREVKKNIYPEIADLTPLRIKTKL